MTQISNVLQFLANRISLVATSTLCEDVISDCAQLSACSSYIQIACPAAIHLLGDHFLAVIIGKQDAD